MHLEIQLKLPHVHPSQDRFVADGRLEHILHLCVDLELISSRSGGATREFIPPCIDPSQGEIVAYRERDGSKTLGFKRRIEIVRQEFLARKSLSVLYLEVDPSNAGSSLRPECRSQAILNDFAGFCEHSDGHGIRVEPPDTCIHTHP